MLVYEVTHDIEPIPFSVTDVCIRTYICVLRLRTCSQYSLSLTVALEGHPTQTVCTHLSSPCQSVLEELHTVCVW